MGTSNDPRLSEQQVTELLAERDILEGFRSWVSTRIQEINCKIQSSGEAKLWDLRRKTITAAIAAVDGTSDAFLDAWLTRTSFPVPVFTRADLRDMLVEAARRDVGRYDAWTVAVYLMAASREVQP